MKHPIVAVTRAVPGEFVARLAAMPWQVRLNDSVEPLGPGLAGFLHDADAAILAPYDRIDATLLERCASLRVAANASAGYDNLDLRACTARAVKCANAPNGVTASTADFAIGLLIAAARRIAEANELVRAGGWQASTYEAFMAPTIGGSTMGLLGMGRIGQAIARRASNGFGMRVLYWSRSRLDAATETEIGVTFADKAQLLRESDHIVAALPLSPETRHAIGRTEFALMRQGATFVHIGRGGVVDDEALAAALTSGHLAGAGVDVFEGEPRINAHLLQAPRLVLTPHIASATLASRIATLEEAIENVRSALEGGQPPNLLNRF